MRIVFEPRNRTLDPVLLMESLFKMTELESRISMNMNVLTSGLVPKVLNLQEALREWLDHRRVVLNRRSQNRLNQIERRLEIVRGLLIVYLDLDRVINRMLIVAAKTMGADKIANLQFDITPDDGVWTLRKLLGWRSGQANAIAVRLDDVVADPKADQGPEPAAKK